MEKFIKKICKKLNISDVDSIIYVYVVYLILGYISYKLIIYILGLIGITSI